MLNQTIIGTKSIINSTVSYIQSDLYPRGYAIVDAPFKIPEMLWMLVPIIVSLVLMEFYFGRYKEEELGWNTAFGNALVLTFVAIDLFRQSYEATDIKLLDALVAAEAKAWIAITVFGFALLLVLLDFFHFLPKKVAYAISSGPFIHMISLLGIIIVYANIPLDMTTLFACILLFIFVNLIMQLLYYIIPSYHSPMRRILTADDIKRINDQESKK